MVLISLHPFAFRKIFLVAAVILGLSSAVCFGDSVFMAKRHAGAAQRPDTAVRGEHSPTRTSSEPVLPPTGHWNIEDGRSELGILIDNVVITPIVDQVGHVPVCIRCTQPVNTARPI